MFSCAVFFLCNSQNRLQQLPCWLLTTLSALCVCPFLRQTVPSVTFGDAEREALTKRIQVR